MKYPQRKISQCILPFRNFAKFTVKHLCQSLFFKARNFIKKETAAQVCFSVNFVKFLRRTFFIEHLWATASHVYVVKNQS